MDRAASRRDHPAHPHFDGGAADRVKQRTEPGNGVLAECPRWVGLVSGGRFDAPAKAAVDHVAAGQLDRRPQLGGDALEALLGVKRRRDEIEIAIVDGIPAEAERQVYSRTDRDIMLDKCADVAGPLVLVLLLGRTLLSCCGERPEACRPILIGEVAANRQRARRAEIPLGEQASAAMRAVEEPVRSPLRALEVLVGYEGRGRDGERIGQTAGSTWNRRGRSCCPGAPGERGSWRWPVAGRRPPDRRSTARESRTGSWSRRHTPPAWWGAPLATPRPR